MVKGYEESQSFSNDTTLHGREPVGCALQRERVRHDDGGACIDTGRRTCGKGYESDLGEKCADFLVSLLGPRNSPTSHHDASDSAEVCPCSEKSLFFFEVHSIV